MLGKVMHDSRNNEKYGESLRQPDPRTGNIPRAVFCDAMAHDRGARDKAHAGQYGSFSSERREHMGHP